MVNTIKEKNVSKALYRFLESASSARGRTIRDVCVKAGIAPHSLIVVRDDGKSMRTDSVQHLVRELHRSRHVTEVEKIDLADIIAGRKAGSIYARRAKRKRAHKVGSGRAGGKKQGRKAASA